MNQKIKGPISSPFSDVYFSSQQSHTINCREAVSVCGNDTWLGGVATNHISEVSVTSQRAGFQVTDGFFSSLRSSVAG